MYYRVEKQEPKHVGAGQTPECGGWKVLTLKWLAGERGMCLRVRFTVGLRRKDFPVGVC